MKLSLKAKLCIWYFIAMMLLSAIFFTAMYYALAKTLHDREFINIKKESSEAAHYISFENGNVKIIGNYIQNFIDHGGFAAIYDMQGKLLAGKLPGDAVFQNSANFENIFTVSANDEKTIYIVADTQLEANNSAIGWMRLSTIQYSGMVLEDIINIYILIIPIYIGLAVAGSLFLTTKALSPINKIISTANKISSGNLSVRIGKIGGSDEVEQLSQSIDNMMDVIESSYNRQRQFTQDASHELRTPITIITTTAEEALFSAVTIDDFKETLRTILDKGNSMSSLISQLLLIGKGFNERHTPEKERIDLSMTTQLIVDELTSYASDHGVSLHPPQIESNIFIYANQTLLTRLMINIIENAIKYNRQNGNVWVCLYNKNTNIYLTIKDDGIGIAENDLPYIWDRFYKSDRSRADSGVGLGLSMVKWIANIHNWTINVESKINNGSIFEVVFQIDSSILHKPQDNNS